MTGHSPRAGTGLSDQTAALLDLDPWTRSQVEHMLGGLSPTARNAVDRAREGLVARFGAVPVERSEPETSAAVWVCACIEVAPLLAGWMRERGIPADVIGRSLADVGRHLRLHRAHTGAFGLDAPWWLTVVLSGSLFQLGRLQFMLHRLGPGEPAPPVETGPWVLDVHIPEAGPLTPAAVDLSFRRAVEFYAAHFPGQPTRVAVCSSWLLDPHLGEHLAPTSNIVRFQRGFMAYGDPRDDGLDAVYFTFGVRSLDGLDRLPRASSLQRLVLARIGAGGRWQSVRGYRRLP
jgi:GNAT-like C-terminal domain/N-acyltransferase N-terminal domain